MTDSKIYRESTPEQHTANALHVFDTHYYKRDANGNLLENSPDEVFNRVCDFYRTRAGDWYDGFIGKHADDLFEIQKRKFYTFNSPTYYNAHPENKKPLLFACFLGNLQDNMDSITNHVGRFAKVFQQGAGIGINIGALRPKGASIGDGGVSVAGKTGSSGAVSYMKLYNMTGEIVKSAGKRRAAIMIMIDDHHPDLLEFITCKSGPDRRNFENMNISVAVTDKFMKAVDENGTWDLTWKGTTWATYPARELWNKIISHAHKTGDPGIFFIDRANEYNTGAMNGTIRCTNPCGEICLGPDLSCNLGALNLYQIALNTKDAKNNIPELMKNINSIAKIVFPFLEANIDITVYPDKEFEKNTRSVRPIGMGISGLGEMFFHLGMKFGSPESCQLASDIMEELTLTALEWSTTLPKEYSTPLLDGNEEMICGIFQKYHDASAQKERWSKIIANVRNGHLRNLFVTTIAPTGNTGIAMDSVSGGCEPVYALGYTRNLSTGGKLQFVDPEFEKVAKERGLDVEKVLANGGTMKGMDDMPDDVKDVFVVANDIPWVDRVNMQSALQRFTTLSISSTLNIPNATPFETIGDIYMDAWKKQCKGITIFRDGSLDSTPLETTKSHENKENAVKSGVALGDVAQEEINNKFAGTDSMKSKMAEVVPLEGQCNRCEIK